MPAKRDSRLSFHEFDEAAPAREPSPSHADSSHVARRRQPSEPRAEFSVDEFLELVDDSPEPPRVRSLPPPLPPQLPTPTPAPPTTAPFVVPTIATVPPPRTRRSFVVLGLVVVTIAGALVAWMEQRASEPSPVAVVVAPPPRAPTPAPASTIAGSAPAEEIAPLGPPPPPMGEVIGAEGHRLWIDERLAPSWRMTVRCGPHTVQVGSAGTPRVIDVPCEGEVRALP